MIASGAADNTVRLWEIRTGKCLKVWEFNTAVKRVEFNEDGSQLLAVTEKRMGFLGTIEVMDINLDPEAEQSDEKVLTITCEESKATVAGWSYLSKYIIAGHEDGTVSQYDAKVWMPWIDIKKIWLTRVRLASNLTTPKSTSRICQLQIFSGLLTGHTSLPHRRIRPQR